MSDSGGCIRVETGHAPSRTRPGPETGHAPSLHGRWLAVAILLCAHFASATPALIPWPREVQWTGGESRAAGFALRADAGSARAAAERNFRIRAEGLPLALAVAALPGEAYELDSTPTGVMLRAGSPAGLHHGLMTLRQLARREGDALIVPHAVIRDAPAFAWRGFMHDTGRNPQDLDLLKRFVDVMAQYKLNVFHWHLTDYPGYRIECRVHPELNDPKFMTRRPGFFYTYAQINELIAFARDRGIEVLPEIDLPGHSAYFQRAFGFDMQDPRGMKILEAALNEFMDHVQTPALHIGSDEVHLRNPQFLDHFAELVRARGRRVVVWRPGGIPKGALITQAWSAGGKPNGALPGMAWLDSRHNYINHMDPFDGPCRILNLAVCDQAAGDDRNLGGILCHWPDINAGAQENVYRQSPVMPALVAAAESYWRGGTPERKAFWGRLPRTNEVGAAEYEDFERRMIARRDLDFADWPFPYVKQTHISWRLVGPADWSQAAVTPEQELRETYDVGGKTLAWTEARGATIHINHFWYDGWLPKASSGTVYAVTHVWSPKHQPVDFWIGFDEPSRSDRRAPNAPAGKWNHSGARIWIGDQEILPPVWKQPGLVKKDDENPFVDEGYFFRPPVRVALAEGWNRILIKAPHAAPDWKWMFTCVPVRLEGFRAREVEGLRFAVWMP